MLQREKAKEWFEKAKKDFEGFRKKLEFTTDDEEQLISDLTNILGWYNINPDPELEQLIEQMIDFGERKQWSMAGSLIEFDHTKKRHQSQ